MNMGSEGKRPVTLKIILIGNSGVGKSSFMYRYVNHRFTNMYRATVGTDFLSKTVDIDRDRVTLQIWDTAGTERFQSLGTPLYRGAHCCMLVFDVTSRSSFSALDAWRKEFLVQGEPQDPSDFPFIVLGNKTDLRDREVSASVALQWCDEIGAEYFEGSAKEDVDVEKTFLRAAQIGLQQSMWALERLDDCTKHEGLGPQYTRMKASWAGVEALASAVWLLWMARYTEYSIIFPDVTEGGSQVRGVVEAVSRGEALSGQACVHSSLLGCSLSLLQLLLLLYQCCELLLGQHDGDVGGLLSCLEDSLDSEGLGLFGGCRLSSSLCCCSYSQLLVRQASHHECGSLTLRHQL
ncbi:hypothetical protein INR49_012711 [Caranx melampygus]|nr:hypothetical protein INR49_012711 [Caranx melampygus]